MIQMKALVGFSDASLITETRPNGGIPAGADFPAPNAEIASRLAAEGLAERVKTSPQPPKT